MYGYFDVGLNKRESELDSETAGRLQMATTSLGPLKMTIDMPIRSSHQGVLIS